MCFPGDAVIIILLIMADGESYSHFSEERNELTKYNLYEKKGRKKVVLIRNDFCTFPLVHSSGSAQNESGSDFCFWHVK